MYMQVLCLQIHLHRQRTRCFFPQSKFETETKKKCDQFHVASNAAFLSLLATFSGGLTVDELPLD